MLKKNKTTLYGNAACFLVSSNLMILAHSGSAAADAEVGSHTLDEIIVTARKREEDLQSVPAAITAFSRSAIEDAGISTIDDVTLLIPNLSIANTQNMGTAFINIRGVGQYRNSEAPVAVVIDGVQMVSPNQLTQDLFDIEQIEVLKGPQGALYGRNASGGAINITTRKPTNEFEGYIKATYAEGEDYRVQAAVSGALVEDLILMRAAASYRDAGGLLTNEFLDRKVDFMEDNNYRAQMLIYPSDRLSLDLRASYSDSDGGAAWFVPLEDDDANNFDVPIQADAFGFGDRTIEEYAIKIDYEMDFANLTSVSSYTAVQEFFFEDLDWLSVPILTADQDLDNRSLSQEVRLVSNSDGGLRWMFGAYYLETQRDLLTFVEQIGVARIRIGDLKDDNDAWAVFGNIDYDISENLELSLGLRYDEDRRQQKDFISNGVVSAATFDELQPKIVLSWEANDNLITYASYGSGYRSGGFNATATFGRQYEAEVVESAEFGFKSTFMSDALVINGAVFFNDFENIQQFVLDANSGGQSILNVPSAEVYGMELELQVYNLVEGLQIFASLGLQDSEIQSEPVGLDPAAIGYSADFSFVGNKVPLVYEWSYVLGAQYRLDISGNTSIVMRGDYSARGGNYWEANNLDRQDSLGIFNARATFEHGNYGLTLWVQNLFDEDYYEEFVSREFGGLIKDVGFPARPRQVGITATYNF